MHSLLGDLRRYAVTTCKCNRPPFAKVEDCIGCSWWRSLGLFSKDRGQLSLSSYNSWKILILSQTFDNTENHAIVWNQIFLNQVTVINVPIYIYMKYNAVKRNLLMLVGGFEEARVPTMSYHKMPSTLMVSWVIAGHLLRIGPSSWARCWWLGVEWSPGSHIAESLGNSIQWCLFDQPQPNSNSNKQASNQTSKLINSNK